MTSDHETAEAPLKMPTTPRKSQVMCCIHYDEYMYITDRYTTPPIEEEEEAFYIRVPSPIKLIGWNIQCKTKHKR